MNKIIAVLIVILSTPSVHSAPAASPVLVPAATAQAAAVDRERARFEELFIQNMVDELKLPSALQPSFTKALQRLNREKAKANDELAAALVALESAQNESRGKTAAVPGATPTERLKNLKRVKVTTVKSASEKALRRYEKAMGAYSALPMIELARLRKILGAEKLGQYLIAKSQMAEKLKALSAREVPAVPPAQTPPSVAPTATPQ